MTHLTRSGRKAGSRSRYPLQVTANLVTLIRRTAALAAGVVLMAGVSAPASADVPEGWSDPDPVSALHALLLLGGVPLLLFTLIFLAVYLPSLLRGERVTPSGTAADDQWFGGPRKGTAELAGPDNGDSKAGGASARW